MLGQEHSGVGRRDQSPQAYKRRVPQVVIICRSPLTAIWNPANLILMISIEHDFDATVITLTDEGGTWLQEDITIQAFEDCYTVEQLDPRTDRVQKITFSPQQLRDLAAALSLPEGVYRLSQPKG